MMSGGPEFGNARRKNDITTESIYKLLINKTQNAKHKHIVTKYSLRCVDKTYLDNFIIMLNFVTNPHRFQRRVHIPKFFHIIILNRRTLIIGETWWLRINNCMDDLLNNENWSFNIHLYDRDWSLDDHF